MLTDWTLDPLQLAPVVLAAFAYATRARTLRRRGTPMPLWRVLLFSTGIGLLLLAFASPIAAIGEQELFSVHMLQHVIIGDLAPLCLLAGLTGPMLRPLLALPAGRAAARAREPVRGAAALGGQSLRLASALPLRGGGRALRRPRARAHLLLQRGAHWLPVLETLPAPEWFGTGPKLAYIAIVRLVETLLGNVFVWSGTVFYGVYVHATSSGGSRRCRIRAGGRGDDDRGLARHDRRARVALPAAGAGGGAAPGADRAGLDLAQCAVPSATGAGASSSSSSRASAPEESRAAR